MMSQNHVISSLKILLIAIDDDPRLRRHPLTAGCHPQALAWTATHKRVAGYDLHLPVNPCVAIDYGPTMPGYSLRLTTTEVRHSYGLKMRNRDPLSILHGPNSHCLIPVCTYTFGYLQFPLVYCGKPPCKGFGVAVCRQGVAPQTRIIIAWCKFAFWGGGCVLGVSLVVALLGYLLLLSSGLCFSCVAKNTSYS